MSYTMEVSYTMLDRIAEITTKSTIAPKWVSTASKKWKRFIATAGKDIPVWLMMVVNWKASAKRHKKKVRVASPAVAPVPAEEKLNWVELERERVREQDERLRRNRAARLAKEMATG